jgi:hypothetical protein
MRERSQFEKDMQLKSERDWIIDIIDRCLKNQKAYTKKLEETVDLLGKPCKCDPVGSGEEYCNGGCEMREEIEKLTGIIDKSLDLHGMTRALKLRIEELKDGFYEINTFIEELEEEDYNNPREAKMAFNAIETVVKNMRL